MMMLKPSARTPRPPPWEGGMEGGRDGGRECKTV